MTQKSNLASRLRRTTPPPQLQTGSGLTLSTPTSDDSPQKQQHDQQQIDGGTSQLLRIPIDHILDSPFQDRESIDEEKYRALVQSMRERGFRGALVVTPIPEREGYYLPVFGGHLRKRAALEAGIYDLPVVVVDATREEIGLGTAIENLARQDLNTVEKGRLFTHLRKDHGWSQQELAEKLGITRDYIAQCELGAKSAPEIQKMLMMKGDGGFRAASYLRRLDKLDETEPGRATTLRVPLIEQFIAEAITTDDIKVAVEKILDPPEKQQREVRTEDMIRMRKIEETNKRLAQYSRLIGNNIPSAEERAALRQLHETIDALLKRE
jgi:ParB family transcriptional regulator, chromosome partitioning protein